MPKDLQTLRGRIFFWIGLVILPVFWIWWMRPPHFSLRQIRYARLWTLVFFALAILAWHREPSFRDRIAIAGANYGYLSFQVGLALWVWLLFRTLKVADIILLFIVSMDAIAMLASLSGPMFQKFGSHPSSLAFVVLPALIHLLVEPAKSKLKRFRW